MNYFKLFLLYFFISPHSQAAECLEAGELRFISGGKASVLKSAYCFNQDRTTLISANCSSEKCEAIKNINPAVKLPSYNGVGSPGFSLCYALKGKPEVLSFYDGKKWFELDRCYFAKDDSYIDTGLLLEKWRKQQ